MEKGLRRRSRSRRDPVSPSERCPDGKGIKTALGRYGLLGRHRLNDALMEKGLRPIQSVAFHFFAAGLNDALMEKGLRQTAAAGLPPAARSERCPDGKGIKTVPRIAEEPDVTSERCPDGKGIKTAHTCWAGWAPAV